MAAQSGTKGQPYRPVISVVRGVLVAAVLLPLTCTKVSAQDIDYQKLEQLFGEPVTSSATGKPQRASDVPADMDIITQDDIRRSGATSIPEALQFVTGVDVRSYGIANAEVGMHGYNQPYNPRLLVLVNGRQVYSDDYGHVSWPTIPVQLAEIRQIEVIKGPNSALYGFNAVSGVINIITYNPLLDRVNTATLLGGTQDYVGGSVVGTGQIGETLGVRLSAGGFSAHDFGAGALGAADIASRNRWPEIGNFNVDARGHVAPGVEVFAEASMGNSRYAEKALSGGFDTTDIRSNSLRVGITADTGIGLIDLNAYRNQELLSIFTAAFPPVPNWVREDVYVVQANDLVKLGSDHTIRVGLEYRNNAATAPGFTRGTIGYNDYGASVMWNWTMTPRLAMTNAVRVDDLQLNYSGTPAAGSGYSVADYNHAGFAALSFNSGLVFNVTGNDTLRFSVARGLQVPSLVDFGLQFPAGSFGPLVIAGNPNLHPSTVDNIEFDYDRTLPMLSSTLRTAIYAQRMKEILSQPFAVPPVTGTNGLPLLLSSNVGSSDAVGLEIGIKGHSASGFRWNASYVLAATTNETVLNQGTMISSPIDYAHSMPRHVATAGVGYTVGKLEIDLQGRWQSNYLDYQSSVDRFRLQPVEIHNYVTLNAHAGYRLTEYLSLGLTAQQFSRSRLLETAGPPVERRILGSVTAHF